jgi:glyoxylase-like metal-dependent hydrolase (beta-lactamase superfamily II)
MDYKSNVASDSACQTKAEEKTLSAFFTAVTEEVFQVGGGSFTSPEDAAIYLIRFDDKAALVDAGCGRSTGKLFRNLSACGARAQDIEYLLITHCHYDHTGGAQEIKDRTGCRIVAHELDARFLEAGDNRVTAAKWYGAMLKPFHVDVKLAERRTQITLGTRIIEALHVPGHSPGSLVYVTESEGKKVLFGQDVHGPLDASLLSNREAYLESLRFLLTLEADILCEGHYGVFRGKEEVADFIESFL